MKETRSRWGGGRTGVEQRGAGRDVDLLQQLQRLRVEEADGGALGKGHPHSAAGSRHVGHADHRVWMDFKLLQRETVRGRKSEAAWEEDARVG